jgi:hypothetical protein
MDELAVSSSRKEWTSETIKGHGVGDSDVRIRKGTARITIRLRLKRAGRRNGEEIEVDNQVATQDLT